MKNILKLIILLCMPVAFWTCTNDDIVVRYPASTPQIITAEVVESTITYGDSIHVNFDVADNVAPLSTLLIRVVVNNEVVISETVRTKGNQSTVQRAYHVPFVENRPDNEPVKIYATLTNVSGTEKDSIISTTIAKRPVITDLYLVPDFGQGATIKLTLTDDVNLIYKATGFLYGTSFNYKIATKLDRFQRIDWSGMVFGNVGDKIGLIDINGLSINATDESLVGISEFTFDALKFTAKVGGKLLEPVVTLDINADLPLIVMGSANFRGTSVYFGENVEVTFTGITNLTNNLSPDYFEVTGANTAKFLGKTGLYKAYYLISAGYLYIEPLPETIYPDALWICGNGFGRPSAPYTVTSSWNWNSPLDYAPCRLVSTGIYQVTIYAKNTPTTGIIGSFNFKFFDKRGWWDGHEQWSTSYTVSEPLAPSNMAGNIGNTVGLSSNPFEGVYRITLNQNDMTIKAEKIN
jgi:hypothetical protein